MKLILARLCILLIGLAVVEAVPGFAQTPRQITWEQLVPGGEKPLPLRRGQTAIFPEGGGPQGSPLSA